MLKSSFLDLPEIKKNAGLLAEYDPSLNGEYGTDGIQICAYNGLIYKANETKANMGNDVPDANANWVAITSASDANTVPTTVVLTTSIDLEPSNPVRLRILADGKVRLYNDTTEASDEVTILGTPDTTNWDNPQDINLQYRLNNVTVGAETIVYEPTYSDATKHEYSFHFETITTATIASGTKIAVTFNTVRD